MKLTEIILQGTAPVQTRALWAKPSDDGIVELKVFNNGAWQDTFATPDLSPYMKTSDFNEEIAKYLLKTDASTLYQTKTDDTLATTDKTVVGAINEILPKATGVGKVDASSDGSGEIFNSYEGDSANVASGDYSHAEGYRTKATGRYSHAEGQSTTAIGSASHAEGYRTETFEKAEHAEGQYNISYQSIYAPIQVIHSVGIGSSEDDRKNAHEIKLNGDHYVYGVGGYDGTNATSEDSKTLQEVINSKQDTITAGTGLEFEGNTLNVTLDTTVFKVVSALPDSPAQGDENKIHLVPAESTGENNTYTEYVWVNSAWEILGEYTSEVDLTPYLKIVDAQATYATKTELTEGLAEKQDAGSYATTTQLEALQTTVDSKADSTALPTYTTVPTLTADYNIPANTTTVEKVYDITVGGTLFNITYDTSIKWVNDVAPITRVNHRYVVSIINNLGVWGEF